MFKKIQTKISVISAIIFTLSFILVFSIVLSNLYNNDKGQAESLVKVTSDSYAKDITNNLNILKTVATSLDKSIQQNMASGFFNRDNIINMQKEVLNQNPQIYGVTVAFEPNKFDGKDSSYVGDPRFGATGSFIPYVTRNNTGFHIEAAYDDTTDMTWYDTPKSTKKIFVTEPTTYKVNGKNVSMASLVLPMLDSSGNFIGVISLDYDLSTFQSNIKTVKTLQGGAILISKNGLVIADGVDNTALMTDVKNTNPDVWKQVLSKTSTGESMLEYVNFNNINSLLYAAPVNLEGTQTNWSLVSVIPSSSVFANFNGLKKLIIIIACIILLLLVFIMFMITGIIVKGIKYTENQLSLIADGDLSMDVNPKFLHLKDEIGSLARKMQDITDNLREKAKTAEKISQGDLNVQIQERSSKDVLSQSMKKMVSNIQNLITEARNISLAAVEGNIEKRGDENNFSGGYREIISGINNTLDAVDKPVQELRSVLSKMSVNDFTQKMEGTYQGIFKNLATETNLVHDGLLRVQNIIIDISHGDTSKFEEAQKYGSQSENDQLVPAVIRMMDTINNLINEVKTLSIECVNGNFLNVRGDTKKFEGGFLEIIEGFNGTLNAIAMPMSELMHNLEALAVNDFTNDITNDYHGDYKLMMDSVRNVVSQLLSVQDASIRISNGDISYLKKYKEIGKLSENDRLLPALIQMMESVQTLIGETTAIAAAAADGNLDYRSKTGSLSGEYANILSGFDKAFAAMTAPMNEIADVTKVLMDGNLSISVSGNYNGIFKIVSDDLNGFIGNLREIVSHVSEVITNISNGNINIGETKSYQGDWSGISTALGKIIENLNNLVGSIANVTQEVAAGSRQVSSGSQSLSQSSTEQASTVDELSASVSQIAAQTKQNALNAKQVNQLVSEFKINASNGSNQMSDMLKSMEEISESSVNVSKIIKVINDIAFQTNILALNAAVEAARAGQYGKGFAVVADEVRSLSIKSAEAAKNTAELIETTLSKISYGTDSANKASQAFNSISIGVGQVAKIMEEISQASNEQATRISEIDIGIGQVSQVIQTTSATAEETAASSEELTSQADILREQVSKFELKK